MKKLVILGLLLTIAVTAIAFPASAAVWPKNKATELLQDNTNLAVKSLKEKYNGTQPITEQAKKNQTFLEKNDHKKSTYEYTKFKSIESFEGPSLNKAVIKLKKAYKNW